MGAPPTRSSARSDYEVYAGAARQYGALINIVHMAISAGATFVARAFTGQIAELADIMVQAIHHPGFAVVDILQPCVSFNHLVPMPGTANELNR